MWGGFNECGTGAHDNSIFARGHEATISVRNMAIGTDTDRYNSVAWHSGDTNSRSFARCRDRHDTGRVHRPVHHAHRDDPGR